MADIPDDPESLEQEKFNLERKRLAFETAKLQEEVCELRRPWYKKPAYLSPLATIIVAITAGLVAFGTDVFKSNVISLKKERDQLQTSVSTLKDVERRLSADNRMLEGRSEALDNKVETLAAEATELEREKQRLQLATQEAQRENESLQREIMLTEMKTHLDILRSAGEYLRRSNQSLENIVVIAERNSGNREFVSTLEKVYNDPSSSPELKSALCLALYKATNRPSWKTELRESSLSQVLAAIGSDSSLGGLSSDSIFLSLLREESVFTLAERSQTLRTLHSATFNQPVPTIGQDPSYILVRWDEDVTVAFRDPWFEHLTRLYDQREWERSSFAWSPKLFNFSPQAFGILLLKALSDRDATTLTQSPLFGEILDMGQDIVIPTNLLGAGDCPAWFPRSFPLSKDCVKPGTIYKSPSVVGLLSFPLRTDWISYSFVIRERRIPAYRQWVNENDKLVSVWTDRTFARLRSCDDEVMRRIIRGWWVGMSDLDGGR